jgi:hypothetical protein
MANVWIRRGSIVVVLALLATLGGESAFVQAGGGAKRKVVEAKIQKAPPGAATVDFIAELGLDVDSLKTLGQQIDSARNARDPVQLLVVAKTLGAAEEVADKKASIKAADLVKEAIEMAKYRNTPDELKVVAKMLGARKVARDLVTQAEKVAKAQKARGKKKNGDKEKGIKGYLVVQNDTRFYLSIYVNYRYVGILSPYATSVKIYVGDDAYATTVLEASNGSQSIKDYVSSPADDFLWRVYTK